jgi:hypothetical protein
VAGLKDNTQATLPIAATKTEPEKPLSMRDLLSDEFPGVLRHSAELPFNFDDTAPGLSVFVVVYQDPRSGGEFLGFYVPHTAKTFDVVQNIFQRHLDVMKAVRGDGTIEIRGPGEITGLSTNNTKFSGKVYVYYETRMSLQELGKLDALAQSLGLSPAFRDTQYLLGRQQIKRDIQSHAK